MDRFRWKLQRTKLTTIHRNYKRPSMTTPPRMRPALERLWVTLVPPLTWMYKINIKKSHTHLTQSKLWLLYSAVLLLILFYTICILFIFAFCVNLLFDSSFILSCFVSNLYLVLRCNLFLFC